MESMEDYSKEELLEIINSLKKTKKFGLVWEDKPEKIAIECEQKLPIVQEISDKAILCTESQKSTNLIIEGDNYHALSVLNYTHAGKIDVIYIDPPYNTGNKNFIYNDQFVDKEDVFRHSKWLSFMEKRLRLAKNLLSDNGVIFISIDDIEYACLKLLCDDVFSANNFITRLVWHNNKKGRQMDKHIKSTCESILVYCKNIEKVRFANKKVEQQIEKYTLKDEKSSYRKGYPLHNGTAAFHINNRPNLAYTIYYNLNNKDAKIVDEKIKNGNEYKIALSDEGKKLLNKGYVRIVPKLNTKYNTQRVWRWSSTKFLNEYKTELMVVKEKDGYYFYQKNRVTEEGLSIQKYTNYIDIDTSNGKNDINKIFNNNTVFDFPKPVKLINHLLNMVNGNSFTVLDFFAGSGTTGQAVLELNDQDGGNRQFILATNNEGGGKDDAEENGIARRVTYPRIKTIVTGNRCDGSKYSDGIPANIRYFKTDFVERGVSLDETREKLVARATDAIRIKENTFKEVFSEADLKLFSNGNTFTAIIFDPFRMVEHWSKIEKYNPQSLETHLYIFAYSPDVSAFTDEIPSDTPINWLSKPIPDGILKTYKKLFK